ncbi:uncharacterized protein LOC121877160 [Homarus americanus]|nr:uncharacterized protein LOC121877160 [Homarus americanus]
MRPRSEEYQLPSGLFLLLGYSKTEEALLKSVTGSSALDALMPLQMVVSTLSSKMGEECRLEMYQHTKDNLVLQVRHFRMSNSLGGHSNYTTYKMQEERDRCERPVRQVASMVNKRDPVIHHNVRLSLFVLAEIIDNVPKFRQFNGARPSPLAAGVWACWWAWWMSIAVLVVGGALDDVFGSFDAVFWRTKTTATPTMRAS